MTFIAWLVSLSFVTTFMLQAVAFHRATILRQKGWLYEAEIETGELLVSPTKRQRISKQKLHLSLKGKL